MTYLDSLLRKLLVPIQEYVVFQARWYEPRKAWTLFGYAEITPGAKSSQEIKTFQSEQDAKNAAEVLNVYRNEVKKLLT